VVRRGGEVVVAQRDDAHPERRDHAGAGGEAEVLVVRLAQCDPAVDCRVVPEVVT
jgi:hypothetical protein